MKRELACLNVHPTVILAVFIQRLVLMKFLRERKDLTLLTALFRIYFLLFFLVLFNSFVSDFFFFFPCIS